MAGHAGVFSDVGQAVDVDDAWLIAVRVHVRTHVGHDCRET